MPDQNHRHGFCRAQELLPARLLELPWFLCCLHRNIWDFAWVPQGESTQDVESFETVTFCECVSRDAKIDWIVVGIVARAGNRRPVHVLHLSSFWYPRRAIVQRCTVLEVPRWKHATSKNRWSQSKRYPMVLGQGTRRRASLLIKRRRRQLLLSKRVRVRQSHTFERIDTHGTITQLHSASDDYRELRKRRGYSLRHRKF